MIPKVSTLSIPISDYLRRIMYLKAGLVGATSVIFCTIYGKELKGYVVLWETLHRACGQSQRKTTLPSMMFYDGYESCCCMHPIWDQITARSKKSRQDLKTTSWECMPFLPPPGLSIFPYWRQTAAVFSFFLKVVS